MASINRGDNTGAFGNDFLRIYLNNPNNLYIQKAVFQINDDLTKEYYDPIFPLRVNFTGAETNLLRQVNICKLALWDEFGRRRTADGKFTFFVKENRISDPDAPTDDDYQEYPEDTSITFDLTDAEFAAEFVINATPTKMSELQQDIYLMTPEHIIGGRNISTEVDADGYVTINTDLESNLDYEKLDNLPSINGQTLIGDFQIDLEEQVQADWNEEHVRSKAYIKNKPFLSNLAYSGNYADMVGKPFIPTKVSDLDNDLHFVQEETLNAYYNKEEVDELIQRTIDLTPVYERIGDVEATVENNFNILNTEKANQTSLDMAITRFNNADNTLRNAINQNSAKIDIINSSLDNFVTREELGDTITQEDLDNAVNELVKIEEFDEAISKKANKTAIGNGKLSILVNSDFVGEFNANASTNHEINIAVPTKVSELENDAEYVTTEDISLDNIVTKAYLQTALSSKLNVDELGNGILTIKKNGDMIGSFNANSKENHTIDVIVPTKTSELENNSGFLIDTDLDELRVNIEDINIDLSNKTTQITALDLELDNKVNKKSGYSLIANSEITRLSRVDNYDDTEIREIVNTAVEKVDGFDADISGKVDKIDGKGLSTNDYTNLDKNTLNQTSETVTTLSTTVNTLRNKTTVMETKVENLNTVAETLVDDLNAETTARQTADVNLQAQIDAMEAKSTVVDILADLDEKDHYDTSKLQVNDVICILCDESQGNSVTYYRWTGEVFTYIGSEGSAYKKAEADDKFALKTIEINGQSLTSNVELSASDVGALPDTTIIGDANITIQVESKYVADYNIKEVKSFTTNQIEGDAIRIPIPTKTSQLKNDLDFVELDTLVGVYLGEARESYGDGSDTLLWDKCYQLHDFINTNSEHIAALEGNLPDVALTGNYYDLKSLPLNISTNYKTIAKDTSYTDYIDETFLSELVDKGGFITDSVLEDNYALKTEIPTYVSQLENDRGYVTNNAIGRADITIYLANAILGTFNANSREDIAITIPVDTSLSTESINPVQNKLITNELNLKAYDTQVVHNTGNETVNGTKTINSLLTTTQNITDKSTKAATTKFVDDYYSDKDTNIVHINSNENISGNKTFTGITNLSETHGITVAVSDNSTNLATTAWVNAQEYAFDSMVVHDGGDEVINGNKTFAETTTFQGIIYLGNSAHVTTDDNFTDSPVNVSYLTTELNKKQNISNLVTTISASSTDTKYPSAKCVYTNLNTKQDKSNLVTSISASSTDSQYPSAKCIYDILGNLENILREI